MTSTTMTKTEPKARCMSAAEFFQAKLDCEMTPWTLKNLMDKNMMKEVCLIDLRPIEAHMQCRIPMALCIPLAELPAKMNTLPKSKLIVAYCGDMSCGMSSQACLELSRSGFRAMELRGGLQTWEQKGFPVDKQS